MKPVPTSLISYLFAALMAVPALSMAAGEAAPAAAAAPAKVAKPDLVKGEASFTAVCVACHAADGNSAIAANAKLAQQHPEYLIKHAGRPNVHDG